MASQVDSVLLEVAARIIQHHWRERRDLRASAIGSTKRPATPRAPPAVGDGFRGSGASVLDFMPGFKERASAHHVSSGRPASRPPRPRAPGGQPVSKPPGTGAGSCGSSQASTPEAKALQLEDSAERTNREAAAASQAPTSSPAPHPRPPRPASPPLPVQHEAAVGTITRKPFSPAARQLQMGDVRASASSEKMGHIMRMIEELEKQAVEEARQVVPCHVEPTVAPAQPPLQQQQPQQKQQKQSPPHKAHPIARVLAAQPMSMGCKQLVAAAAGDLMAAQALRAAEASKIGRRSAQLLTAPSRAALPATDEAPASSCFTVAAIAPVPAQQAAAVPPMGQLSATAVANSVRAKIHQLQQLVGEKDGQLGVLRQQAEAMQRQQAAALRAAEASHKAQLAEQKAEAEASTSRSMQLIDRIMADKDALTGMAGRAKCAKLSGDVGAMQAEAAKQIEALKEGLARELRKQKDVWVAAERAKREAWMGEQTRSIKASTIKGLEPEIQRLVEAHKAEMKRAEQRHEAEADRRLQAAVAQHEEQLAALRAQAAAERAAAAEMERAAAREQVKDAQSRFEVELQSLRIRLAAEHQMQLDRADSARREDQARIQQQAQDYEQRVAALRAEWEGEKQQLVLQRQQEVEGVRQQYEVNQEAWRAAASERARREMEGREAALLRQLVAERDEELAAVVARLEEDALAKEAAHEVAAEAKWHAEVSRLQAAESSLADQCSAAEARAAAAEAKIGRLEELVHTLQREVSSKGSSLAWLEDQLAAARKDAANQQDASTTALQSASDKHAQELAAVQERATAAEEAAGAAQGELAALRQRRVQEMGELESRFRALLQTKDGTITSLTQQLQELHAALS